MKHISMDSDSELYNNEEYLEHKRKREQRKELKMQLLRMQYEIINITEASTSNIFNGEICMEKKKKRPRHRKKKNKDVENECADEIDNIISNNFNKITIQTVTVDKNKILEHNQKLNNVSPLKNSINLENKSPRKNRKHNKNGTFGKYMPLEEVKQKLKSKELILSNIRIHPKDHKISYIRNPVKYEPDITIVSIVDRNRAMEGDLVVVKLKEKIDPANADKKFGQVVYIWEEIHPRTTIGTLKLITEDLVTFPALIPRDARVPRVKIPNNDCPDLFFEYADRFANVLFHVKITKWEDPRFAEGCILETLGCCNDIKIESTAILLENYIDVTPYSEKLNKYFPQTNEIDSHEFDYRLDLRKECVFTIDPITAKDLDDAVSCKELPNGNYEVGVHIADVTYYLKENTPLDEIVSKRATSTYMVETVYHMLPQNLCYLCSLLPGEDKLTFSIIWELTLEGEIVNCDFKRSIINSCAQLAYEHVQEMLEDPLKKFAKDDFTSIYNNYDANDLSRIVNNLQKIAVNLRQKRFDSGALRIDQPKVSFCIDPITKLPTSYYLYENKESHRLIEEFMLLANMSVARRLKQDYPDIAFLRNHSPPHQYMLISLKSTLEKVGIHLDISSSKGLQQSLWKYTGDDLIGQARALVLSILCAKPMNRATYFSANNLTEDEDYWHYALNVPLYTHFTSPIRRYADIIVHRQLSATLGYTEKPQWTNEYISKIANNCNKKKYYAKKAGEQSIELYLMHYIKQNQPIVEKAVVLDVRENCFDVVIFSNGLIARVFLRTFDNDVQHNVSKENIEVDENEGKILFSISVNWPEKNGIPAMQQIIAIFSIVTVLLETKDDSLKIEAKLVRPNILI